MKFYDETAVPGQSNKLKWYEWPLVIPVGLVCVGVLLYRWLDSKLREDGV